MSARNWIARTKKLVLGQNIRGLLVTTGQGLFLVDPEDLGVGRSLICHGAFGKDEIERICSLLTAESNVLFVGSHIGSLVVPVSKKVRQVVAVEANPDTFQLLTWNLLLNQCANVRPLLVAASDRNGELEFVASRTNSGGAKRMPVVKSFDYFADKPSIIKVNAARLDDRIDVDFDLIVMDIEGSEYFALKGMQRILSRARCLIVEFLPHHIKNVSGVRVEEFLALIEPHFSQLTVPSKSITVGKPQFLSTLATMYSRDECDDGIVFLKASVTDG